MVFKLYKKKVNIQHNINVYTRILKWFYQYSSVGCHLGFILQCPQIHFDDHLPDEMVLLCKSVLVAFSREQIVLCKRPQGLIDHTHKSPQLAIVYIKANDCL